MDPLIQSPAWPAQPQPDLLDIVEDAEQRDDEGGTERRWRVLVVDDDPEVHAATNFALAHCVILGRSLELVSAYSAGDGRTALEAFPDFAVVLLDVVMEEHDSGLRFVEWMREHFLVNQRIILRTGQPGYAPELAVIRDYDINDYRSKGELSQTRLISCMTTAIRMFAQLAKLDEQRFEVAAFSYALAHDFKQTARQIATFSRIAAAPPDADSGVSASLALAYLTRAVRRLSSLIDVMSQYTLLSRPPEVETVDVVSLLDDVRASLADVLTATGGALTTSGSGACRANLALVTQVLRILIANGLQHNDRPAPQVDVSISLDDGHCSISVRDNGVGIGESDLALMFEPHMRLRHSGDLTGTGLGLTLSRRAIESQAGAIWCESTPGVGSTFHVTLPNAPVDRTALS